MAPPVVLIVTPYPAAANNGNVRTAERWARLLGGHYRTIVRTPADELVDADLLIALHARRSHEVLCRWRAHSSSRPALLVLTGTDLYHDVPVHDAAAMHSLELADALVVLQERGIAALPGPVQAKAGCIYQSAEALPRYAKSAERLRVLFVGHLREEKDPFTFIRAAAEFGRHRHIEFAMIGGMRDPALETPTHELLALAPNVRMLGIRSHRETRERIRRAHLLVVPSRMEGGANVIVEAVNSSTAVIVSDCDGNLGMVGPGYPGTFPVRDPQGLAHLIARCWTEPAFLRSLEAACAARAPLFTPEAERNALLQTLARLRAPN